MFAGINGDGFPFFEAVIDRQCRQKQNIGTVILEKLLGRVFERCFVKFLGGRCFNDLGF